MSIDLRKKVNFTFNHEETDILSACGIKVDIEKVDKQVNTIIDKFVNEGKDPKALSMMLEETIDSLGSLEELLAIALPALSDRLIESVRFGIDHKFIKANLDKIPDEKVKKAFLANKIPTEVIPMLAEKLRQEMGISESECPCEKCEAKRNKASKTIPMPTKMGLA